MAGPKNIVEDLFASTTLPMRQDQRYEVAKEGVLAFVDTMVKDKRTDEKVTPSLVDDMIRQIDQKISDQIDEILHNEEFQKMESAWRSLKYLVDHTNYRENSRVDFLHVSKTELIDDFEDAPDITKSALYKLVYTSEYGQFGGKPYSTIIGNYYYGPNHRDMDLLKNIAAVCTMAHAPFISAASPEFFNLNNITGLPNLNDIEAIFDNPYYAKWNSLRESEDSRYVGLTLPRFMLRIPYGPDTKAVKQFNYKEKTNGQHDNYLWGNSAFAFASRVAESFAKYRWCVNIIGPQGGGTVDDLPRHYYEALDGIQCKIPTEVLLSERREYELAEQGFIPLTMRKDSDNAAFFSANSIQKPKTFMDTEKSKDAELNYKLGTQFPYIFIVSRLAHYLKVMQREKIGMHKERIDIERELNDWISGYVVDMENPVPEVRAKKPLRDAKVDVESIPGEPGWYKSTLTVRPHFKYMGAYITLRLVGSLDKE